MRSRVCVTVECPSVRLSVPSTDISSGVRRVCCLAPGWQEIQIDSRRWRTQQQRCRSTALSSKCGQCRVDSRGTRLNTDFVLSASRSESSFMNSARRSSFFLLLVGDFDSADCGFACLQCSCLQCFDTVVWAAERASGL